MKNAPGGGGIISGRSANTVMNRKRKRRGDKEGKDKEKRRRGGEAEESKDLRLAKKRIEGG